MIKYYVVVLLYIFAAKCEEKKNSSFPLNCTIENETKLCLVLEGEHKCGYALNDILWCDDGRLIISERYCMTQDKENGEFEIGRCVYAEKFLNETSNLKNYRKLPKNTSKLSDTICRLFSRNSTLCGKCSDGYYPLAYSYNMTCVECPNGKYNWWKFVLAAFLPLTVFYFIVLFLRINTTSSHLHGLVICSQAASVPAVQRLIIIALYNKRFLLNSLSCFTTLYAVWNLDFFRSFPLGICLGTDTLTTLSLDLAVGVYPLLLMFTSYLMINLYDSNFTPLVVMWRPFKALFAFFLKNVDIRTSLIDSFATFLLLSSIKFLSVSYDLLVPVKVYQVPLTDPFNVTVSWRLYYDATVPYLGKKHLPYAVLAIVVLIIFVFLPIFIITLYPFRFFQTLLNLFPVRWHILHTFVDAFLGCFKDGTEPGTHDCRWFAAIFLLIRPAFFLIGALTLSVMCFVFCSILTSLIIIALINIEPFKAKMKHSADSNMVFLLLLAVWYLCIVGNEYSKTLFYDIYYYGITGFVTVGLISFLYVSSVIIHWIVSHRMFGLEVFRNFQALRPGYHLLEQ